MSDFNSTLTDKQVRELLNTYIMEQSEDNLITDKLIEMESKLVFGIGTAPAAIIPNEQQMLGELTKSFATKSSIYTWITAIAIVTVGGVALSKFTGTTPESNKSEKGIPVLNDQDEKHKSSEEKNHLVEEVVNNSSSSLHKNASYPSAPENQLNLIPNEIPGGDKDENEKTTPPQLPPVPPVPPSNGSNTKSLTINKVDKKDGKVVSKIDTSFANIKRVEINGGICDVTIKGIDNADDKVDVKGEIIIQAKGLSVKTADYTIRHKVENNVLKLTVEPVDGSKNCVIAGSININATLNFTMPSTTEVDVRADNGDLSIDHIKGKKTKVSSAYGDITLSKLNGELQVSAQSGDVSLTETNGKTSIQSTYGDVSLSNHNGDAFIQSSSGSVVIKNLNGSECDIKATYGNIDVTQLSAKLKIASSSGNVNLSSITGNVDLSSQYGDQKLENINGNVNTLSSSGNIHFKVVNGDINVKATYGDIHTNDCTGNITVVAASGNIKGKNVNITNKLDITATYGDIKMQFANKMKDLNFDLQANSGDIQVKRDGQIIKGLDGKLRMDNGKVIIKAVTQSGDQAYE